MAKEAKSEPRDGVRASSPGLRRKRPEKHSRESGGRRPKRGTRLIGLERACDNCGKQYSPKSRAQRRFCSDTCRTEFWKAQRRVNFEVRECAYCGASFMPTRQTVVFCSTKCRYTAKSDKEYFNGLRKTAVGLDKKQCWVCQKTDLKRFHVHHVVKRSDYAGDPLLVVLCRGCHELVSKLGVRTFLDNTSAIEDLITLARFDKGLPNVKTVVKFEEVN